MVAIGKVGEDGSNSKATQRAGLASIDPKRPENSVGTIVNTQKPEQKGTVV